MVKGRKEEIFVVFLDMTSSLDGGQDAIMFVRGLVCDSW